MIGSSFMPEGSGCRPSGNNHGDRLATAGSKPELQGLELAELEELVEFLAEPGYRARQVFNWVHWHGVSRLEHMTNIPLRLREGLAAACLFRRPAVVDYQRSSSGQAIKYVLVLCDGLHIESVRLWHHLPAGRRWYTACVSTQVGCATGCAFCATGAAGWSRNLTTGEIVDQVAAVNAELTREYPGSRVTNVVFMGMGEPLLNYRRVVKAIRLLKHPAGLNIGARRITISTCGIAPQLRRLANEGLGVKVAVSLHAPNNELRNFLVPINRRYPLEELLSACRLYAQKTCQRLTFAYTLIKGVNDSPALASQLAKLLTGIPAMINLIPFNTVDHSNFGRPGKKLIEQFRKALQDEGLHVTVRLELGSEIAGACGQLRGGSR